MYSALTEALANPIKYQSELEKHAQQLAVLTEEDNEEDEVNLSFMFQILVLLFFKMFNYIMLS